MSRPTRTTWLLLGGALLVSVTLNQMSARVRKPLLQTERLLESFGWQDGDLELLEGSLVVDHELFEEKCDIRGVVNCILWK